MPEPTMGEMARWTFYQRFIAERTKDIDPRHVEAWMRLEHPTLDGLSRAEFTEAMYAALARCPRRGTRGERGARRLVSASEPGRRSTP